MSLPGWARRPALATLIALPMLGLLFTIPWLWAEHRLGMALDRWITTHEAEGWSVQRGSSRYGGWPFRAVLDTFDMSVSGGESVLPGGMAWHTPTLRLSVPVTSKPDWVTVTARGEQRWRFPHLPEVTWRAGGLRTLIRSTATSIPSIRISDLVASIPGHAPLRVGSLGLDANGPLASPFRFFVDAWNVSLPPNEVYPGNPDLRTFRINAVLDGPVPVPDDSLAKWAIQWRDANGRLILHNLDIDWGGGMLAMMGHATLLLDPSMQPAGTAWFTVFNWQTPLDYLIKRGILSEETGARARAAFTKSSLDGYGGTVVGADLSLRDRTLFLASVPLFRIPTLTWPDPSAAR